MRRIWHTAIALSVPVGSALISLVRATVMVGKPIGAGDWLFLFVGNALWLGAPHAIVCALALLRRSMAVHVVPVLWCLNAFLIAFKIWLGTQFSASDAAFLWIAYIPAAFVVMFAYGAYQLRDGRIGNEE